jgi:hypothetical protein
MMKADLGPEHLRSAGPSGPRRWRSWSSDAFARLLARLGRLDAGFEGVKRRSCFLESLCILQQSHEAQAHAGGFEAVAHLAGELIVNCEHGSVSFRDAGNVPSTLRSP